MAIKRRDKKPIDSEAIDSFGDAADTIPQDMPEPSAVRKEPGRTANEQTGETWPADLAKTFLVRFPDPSIPRELAHLQEALGRNKHQTMLLALRRGIDTLNVEVKTLGNSADLLR